MLQPNDVSRASTLLVQEVVHWQLVYQSPLWPRLHWPGPQNPIILANGQHLLGKTPEQHGHPFVTSVFYGTIFEFPWILSNFIFRIYRGCLQNVYTF